MVGTLSSSPRLVRNHFRSSLETHPTSDALSPVTVDRDCLYAEFAPLVRRLIRQYGQDINIREELPGEIYCRFCALFEAYDPSRGIPIRPYLVRQLSMATYSFARHHWRVLKRETSWEFEDPYVNQACAFDPTGDWLASLAQEQLATHLPTALESLPSRQRNVVIWRYFEERSFEEIGELLGILPSSARSMLRHGLNNLRKAIVPLDQG
ncbi:MAG: polymerase sigma factor [Chthonomonadales bacterium]|nr:polymerase sigma factor [Chthonomonadales bacterium]